MKFFLKRIVCLFIFSIATYYCKAQNIFFGDAPENSFIKPGQKRVIVPARYRTLQLNKEGLLNFLNIVPSEKDIVNRNESPVIEIPMPEGGSTKFHIWESPVMEPELAAKFPGIRTFTGQGIDDPTANIKLDFTPIGFHAMIISSLGGAVFIDPYAPGNTGNYISYNKSDYRNNIPFIELPPVLNLSSANRTLSTQNVLAGTCVGSQLRTFRLALAATGEYTAAVGGTVAAAQSAMATTVSRLNGVFEREVAIKMVLVANNNLIIYTDGTTDPYSNNNGSAMLDENQSNLTTVIGNNNYDIGHVFSTGGGGVAGLGVVCITGEKAKGVSGSPNPTGDPFNIDYVAHEMGHQFGASHTFNSNESNCEGNGVSSTNAEPGSGSTIMAYAGICGSDDLQSNSDAQFHAMSFNEITTYNISGNGSTCGALSSTGNVPPVVNAGPDYTIPKSTPFILSGGATDANGDILTFSWEQVNVGGAFGNWNNPSGNAPLFRSFVPVSTPVRLFPKRSDVINNVTTIGEILPAYARTLDFRLTARDNRAGGGGVCFDETAVTVSGAAGPFLVTYPNTGGVTWLVNDFKTIVWDPSGTTAPPISCANVKIELSTDGGLSFPITILASTPNDGLEEIQVPNNVTSFARIRITAVGNVFYDMSNADFSIQNSSVSEFVFSNPLQVISCTGNSAVTSLNTGSLNGFTTAINLSATVIPGVTSVTFGSSPLSPGNTTTVTLNNTGSLANGTYNVTVSGAAGTINKTRVISFVIGVPPAPSNLTVPAANALGVSTLPAFNWSVVSGAGSYTLEISTSNTFVPIIQTVTNITSLPAVLTTPLVENTVYYWRVTSTNICGPGAASATGSFRTGISAPLCPPVGATSLTSNLTGTTYQWQLNTGSGFGSLANNGNYSGVNSVTLQITGAPTSWSGYQYRCLVNGVNSNVYTIGFINSWNGSVSNEWENGANWSCSIIPDQYTDVIINSGTLVVNSPAFCRSIRVNPGSSVTINTGFKITVAH